MRRAAERNAAQALERAEAEKRKHEHELARDRERQEMKVRMLQQQQEVQERQKRREEQVEAELKRLERVAQEEARFAAEQEHARRAAQRSSETETDEQREKREQEEYQQARRRRLEEQQRAQQQQEQQQQQDGSSSSSDSAEADAERAQREQEERDAIAAAAARAYAEAQVALHGSATDGQHVAAHDPAQALLDSLMHRATLFRELLPHNAWSMVQQGRPFAILVICQCQGDDDLDIPALEAAIRAAPEGLADRFTFLWVRSPTREQFSIGHTYGLSHDSPHFVIDNIPIGQHVEKYAFTSGRLARPRDPRSTELIVRFLRDFLLAPTPLPLLMRSSPAPHGDAADEADESSFTPGKVIEVFGDTFERIVLQSPHSVVLMLISPTCPACHNAAPVLDALAQRLSWSSGGSGFGGGGGGKVAEVRVARMDRANNDVPLVLRFASYPALFLYKSGSKSMDTSEDGGEEPGQRGLKGSRGWAAPIDYNAGRVADSGSCNAPLSVDALYEWVMKHTGDGGFAGMLGGGSSTSSSDEDSSSVDGEWTSSSAGGDLDATHQQAHSSSSSSDNNNHAHAETHSSQQQGGASM
jgi:chemotaxis protein histidine kinase CheA